MGYHEVEDTTGDAVNTHQEVIDEFRKQVNYGVMQRTVCAVLVNHYYDTIKQLQLFNTIYDADALTMTEIRSYLQGLSATEALSITKDQLPAHVTPMFVGMSDKELAACASRVDYLCEFAIRDDASVVTIKWCFVDTMLVRSRMVFDHSTISKVSPTAVTLPPLPPVRVQDDLPPPSPAFQASVYRWCDFDGED